MVPVTHLLVTRPEYSITFRDRNGVLIQSQEMYNIHIDKWDDTRGIILSLYRNSHPEDHISSSLQSV